MSDAEWNQSLERVLVGPHAPISALTLAIDLGVECESFQILDNNGEHCCVDELCDR